MFNVMDKQKRTLAIEQAFLGDNVFKKEIQGMILGQLDTSEYQRYLQNERTMNKRIIQMVRNRMLDSVLQLA